jgi:hypothetical protein
MVVVAAATRQLRHEAERYTSLACLEEFLGAYATRGTTFGVQGLLLLM